MEFKSFSNLGMRDLKLFETFVAEIMVISLNTSNIFLKEKIVELRTTYKLKLPDAIIAATAITNNAILITGDKGFKKVKELQLDLIL